MYSCRICNEQVVGDDRALSMHMRTHGFQITMSSPTNHHHDLVKRDNVKHIKSLSEEQHLTSSLVLLSNGSLKPFTLLINARSHASVDGRKAKQPAVFEKPLLEQSMHGNKQGGKDLANDNEEEEEGNEVVRGTFECRACNKVFYSHQALGGHRASHKKIKGCFAAAYLNPDEKRVREEARDHNPLNTKGTGSLMAAPSKTNSESIIVQGSLSTTTRPSKKKPKSHECSICHRVFPSGQALGGHKRCHWLPSSYSSNSSVASDTRFYSVSTFHNFLDEERQPLRKRTKLDTSYNYKGLDLNQKPLPLDGLHKTPNEDKIRVSVGSHTYGVGASVTTNFIGDREIRRDINSIYRSLCQINSTNDQFSLTGKNSAIIDAKHRLFKSIQLKDNNVDGLHPSWLQLGIGSTPIL